MHPALEETSRDAAEVSEEVSVLDSVQPVSEKLKTNANRIATAGKENLVVDMVITYR